MIDTHAHIDGEEFLDDINEVIINAKKAGIEKILIPNINFQTIEPILCLCNEYKGYLFPMIGLHPEDVKPLEMDVDEVLDRMEKMIAESSDYKCPFIAVGEVGLDLYWDVSYREQQIYAFERQVMMAARYHLPLMIHSRKAHEDLVKIIKCHYDEGISGVFHCFTGTAEEAIELLEFDRFVLGVGGVLTFKNSTLPEVLAEHVPLNRIVLETDSPYMAPVPNRGKRNEPKFLRDIALRLTQVYNTDIADVESITNENVKRIFNL